VAYRDLQRRVQVGRGHRVGAGTGQRGPDCRVESGRHHLRAVAQRRHIGGLWGAGPRFVCGDVGRRDGDRLALGAQQIQGRTGERTVGQDAGPPDRGDAENLVDDVAGTVGGDRTQARVTDALQCRQVGLGVVGRCHTQPPGQCTQSVQPGDGGFLAGPGTSLGAGAGVGSVVDDVATGHRIDGDQQVRVDRKAQGGTHLAAGVDGGPGGEIGRRQQGVQPPARGQGCGQAVVDEPHGCGAAGGTRRQPRLVCQGPQHGHPHRMRSVRRDDRTEGVGGRHRVGGGVHRPVDGYTEDGQQEAGVIEPGRRTVIRRAVDVDQHRVDAGLLDVQGSGTFRSQRIRQREAHRFAALHLGRDGDEVGDRLELVQIAGEVGAKLTRGGDRPRVFHPDHHVAHGPVTHIEYGPADRQHRITGGGDDFGGDPVDPDLQERNGSGFTRAGSGRQDGQRGRGPHREQQHHRRKHHRARQEG
jgi:hypothetical protein